MTEDHEVIASTGYPQPVLDHLIGGFVRKDPAYRAMRRGGRAPLRWCDIPTYRDSFSAREVFLPHGFREGVSTCLFTPYGRCTGALHLSTDLDLPFADEDLRLLDALSLVLGSFVDPLRPSPGLPQDAGARAEDADDVAGEVAMVLLDHCGELHRLTGHAGPWLDAALESLGPQLDPTTGDGEAGTWRRLHLVQGEQVLRIVLAPVPAGMVLRISRTAPPAGMTLRELEVLQLLVEGHTNPAIAQRLHISRSTVGTHVEQILAALGCGNRTQAAALAVSRGLVAPSPTVPVP